MLVGLHVYQQLPNGETESHELCRFMTVASSCNELPSLISYVNDWIEHEIMVSTKFTFSLSINFDESPEIK